MTSFDPDAAREGAAEIAKSAPTTEQAMAYLAEATRVLAEAAITISGDSERWTYEQAGEHCGGVTASTYRSYVARQGAPVADRYDPETGRKMVEAEAVRRWFAARPGRGARTDLRQE